MNQDQADTPLNDARDEELIELVKRQDYRAFEELVKRHQDKVYYLIYSMIRDEEEARDLAQEIFLKLWQQPHMYRPHAAFTTFLYRVTYNRTISHIRLKRLRQFLSLSSSSSPLIDIPDPAPDSIEQLIKKDTFRRLNSLLSKLPPRQRAALVLRYGEGLNLTKIAEILSTTPKAAEGLIYRALRTLKQWLNR